MAYSFGRRSIITAAAVCLVLFTACGDDGDDEEDGASSESPTTSVSDAAPNACPADGCRIRIADVTRAPDGELVLTLDANFTADAARNHFHVFWDTFKPEQVSDDAERKHAVKQGDWVPTADNPFTTADAVSVKVRGQSTKVCVTAGDRDHNVIDPTIFECRDVAGLLT